MIAPAAATAPDTGFRRLAEMEERSVDLQSRLPVPVGWATQVLETLVKEGLPTQYQARR